MYFPQRSGQNGRLNPLLRMGITTEAGALFDNHPRLKNKALLLDITTVNPCAGSNLGNAARHVGKHLAEVVERKKNKSPSLQTRGSADEHRAAPFTRPGVFCTSASRRGG